MTKLNGDCCTARVLYLAASHDAHDPDSCYESFDLCLFRLVEGGLEDIRDHGSCACRSVVQRLLGAQQNSSECMYQYSDRFLRSRVEGEVEVGHRLEVAEDEAEGGCLEEGVGDVMSRLYAEVVVCASRNHFAMLVFLLAEGCRVREDASRRLVLGEESFDREVDLYARNQSSRLEDRSCGHHQRPKPHLGPYRLSRQRGQVAWQRVFRDAFCDLVRVTLRSAVGPRGEKEGGGF